MHAGPGRAGYICHISIPIHVLTNSQCIRLQSGSCQRCTTTGCQCITSHGKSSRPYYQTSKEQFDLMTTIVRNFLPDVSMETEDLRKAVSKLRDQSQHDSVIDSQCRSEGQEQQLHTPRGMQGLVTEPQVSHADSTTLGETPLDDSARNSNDQAAAPGFHTVNLFHMPARSPEAQGGSNKHHPVLPEKLLSPLLAISQQEEPANEKASLVSDARDIRR